MDDARSPTEPEGLERLNRCFNRRMRFAGHLQVWQQGAAGLGAGVPHAALFWRSGKYRVVREGNWKLQSLDLPRQDLLFDLRLPAGHAA